MATNVMNLKRPSDRNFYLAAAIVFPLLVLIGYFRSYYGRVFFESPPELFGWLVHIHGFVMSAWVLYFTAQVALVRIKNIKLHIAMGFAGIGLAALAVITGIAAAYKAHIVEGRAPAGLEPHPFFIIPVGDMFLFVLFFAVAIYYRKKPAIHKSMMLMTAINFLPPALARMPVVAPELTILWAFGISALVGLIAMGWMWWKHGKFNWIFASAHLLFLTFLPARIWFSNTEVWLSFTRWLA